MIDEVLARRGRLPLYIKRYVPITSSPICIHFETISCSMPAPNTMNVALFSNNLGLDRPWNQLTRELLW